MGCNANVNKHVVTLANLLFKLNETYPGLINAINDADDFASEFSRCAFGNAACLNVSLEWLKNITSL